MKKTKFWLPAAFILCAVILNITGRACRPFTDFYVTYIFPIWGAAYGKVTGLVPFSVGEWMLYLAVVMLFVLVLGGAEKNFRINGNAYIENIRYLFTGFLELFV